MQQKPSKPRLFFALWPEAPLRRGLEAIAAQLPGEGGRMVSAENFHITLIFLGATPAERIPALMEAAGSLEAPAFDFPLERVGWWKRSGIFWLAPAQTPAPLRALAESLATIARARGLDVRLEDFQPHLTLMRKAERPPAAPAFAPLPWRARDFLLLESITRPEGPEYRQLGRWPLR